MFSLANITRPEGDPKIITNGPSAVPAADQLAKGLGWFSIGLGMTQLLAPRLLTRALGMTGSEGLVRCLGAREIASGVLTLSTEKRAGVASRILGDGLNIVALVTALGPHNRKRGNAAFAFALVAGVTLIDIAASKALSTTHGRRGNPRSYADRSGFPPRDGQRSSRHASAVETGGSAKASGEVAQGEPEAKASFPAGHGEPDHPRRDEHGSHRKAPDS